MAGAFGLPPEGTDMSTEILKEVGLTETPKRRGRPSKTAVAPSPARFLAPDLTPARQYDLDRVLESFLGKPEVMGLRQQGVYPQVFARYQDLAEKTLEWEAQTPCSHCHARKGYNPLTGIWIRSWDAANRQWIDGHHSSCKTLMVNPLTVR